MPQLPARVTLLSVGVKVSWPMPPIRVAEVVAATGAAGRLGRAVQEHQRGTDALAVVAEAVSEIRSKPSRAPPLTPHEDGASHPQRRRCWSAARPPTQSLVSPVVYTASASSRGSSIEV